MMPMTAIVALGVLTYAFRFTGPLLRGRVTVPAAAERLFADAATVQIIALSGLAALTAGHGFTGWARHTPVLVAVGFAARRSSPPVVVLAAAGVTALLRLAGVP